MSINPDNLPRRQRCELGHPMIRTPEDSEGPLWVHKFEEHLADHEEDSGFDIEQVREEKVEE